VARKNEAKPGNAPQRPLPPAKTTAQPPAAQDEEALEVWATYAKDRYDFQERRRSEFRGVARQLASVIAAVIGLEIVSVGKFVIASLNPNWRLGSILTLLVFFLAVMFQSFLLVRSIRVGFGGEKLLGPESPMVLHEHLIGKDKAEVIRIVSSYYAKGEVPLHELNETLISRIRKDALAFAALFFVIVYIPATVVLLAPAHKEAFSMPTQSRSTPTQPSQPTPTPPSDSSPTPPAPSSPLDTPTPGQHDTAEITPPKIR
jgi:hypothetical protein